MVLPIITSLTREIFLQTPKLHEEAALALGATRWEMIKMAVLPFGRPGIISAVMLGLGRALGETMAVALVLSSGALTASLIQTGNQTIAAEIALNFPEASGTQGQHADRRRPGAVRHHPRREHDRPLDHHPAQRILGSQLNDRHPDPRHASARPSPRASCPSAAPYIVLAVALVLGAAIMALIGFHAFGWGLVSAILFAAGLVGWSGAVEGSPQGQGQTGHLPGRRARS